LKDVVENLLWLLNRFKALPWALKILLSYVCLSLALSLFIFLRFQAPLDQVKWINVALYLLTYYILPATAFFWLYRFLPPWKDPHRWHVLKAYSLAIVAGFCYLLIIFPPIFGLPSIVFSYLIFVPDYLFFWIPIPLMLLVYSKKAIKTVWSKKTMASVFIVAVLMPNLTVLACFNSELSSASSIAGDSGRVSRLSQRVYDTMLTTGFLRAQNDFWKFLMVGTGQCGEMSTATISYLSKLDIEARKVGLPGENHEFVEVKLNGSWWVVDPGYYRGEIITRLERANRRINDVGAISYVVAYVDSSFVELTQEYVPTDTIIIKVTLGGEQLANAQVVLKHLFMNNEWNLPPLYTDGNGTITLHLGALTYNSKANEVEPFFWVYINGQNTERNVTSTGTGQTHLVEIDLVGSSVKVQSSLVR
jgi:hypothetical protein